MTIVYDAESIAREVAHSLRKQGWSGPSRCLCHRPDADLCACHGTGVIKGVVAKCLCNGGGYPAGICDYLGEGVRPGDFIQTS